MSRTTYVPCGAPAVAIIKNRDRRPYYMCEPCADHNVRNRGAKRLTVVPAAQLALLRKPIKVDVKAMLKDVTSALTPVKTVAIRGNGNRNTRDVPPSNPELTGLLKQSVRQARSGVRPKLTRAILGVGVECDMDAEGEYVLPTDQGICADLLHRARNRRLEIEREAERVGKLEKRLQAHFIETLSASSTGLAGREALVKVETKAVPQVEDYDRFWAYVWRTKSFELLRRQVNETAAKEHLDAGRGAAAGLTIFRAKKVSVTKL